MSKCFMCRKTTTAANHYYIDGVIVCSKSCRNKYEKMYLNESKELKDVLTEAESELDSTC